jgi:hypothetical protein
MRCRRRRLCRSTTTASPPNSRRNSLTQPAFALSITTHRRPVCLSPFLPVLRRSNDRDTSDSSLITGMAWKQRGTGPCVAVVIRATLITARRTRLSVRRSTVSFVCRLCSRSSLLRGITLRQPPSLPPSQSFVVSSDERAQYSDWISAG